MLNKKRKIAVAILIFSALAITVFLYDVKFISRESVRTNVPSVPQQSTVADVQNKETGNARQPGIPLNRAGERVTKKPFGIFITPAISPVQPERFRGYHTGADFEILPGEENTDIPVRSVCEGQLRVRQFISGYGGVAIQDCQIDSQNVTVLYGHLSLVSVKWEVGNEILESEIIGNLGDPAKGETDGERKHLHLSIHKGTSINFRGYVNSQTELSSWIDPCLYFCSPLRQN